METFQNGGGTAISEGLLYRSCPQAVGMLKQGKLTFALGLNSIVFKITICIANRKAHIMTMKLKIKDIH